MKRAGLISVCLAVALLPSEPMSAQDSLDDSTAVKEAAATYLLTAMRRNVGLHSTPNVGIDPRTVHVEMPVGSPEWSGPLDPALSLIAERLGVAVADSPPDCSNWSCPLRDFDLIMSLGAPTFEGSSARILLHGMYRLPDGVLDGLQSRVHESVTLVVLEREAGEWRVVSREFARGT